MTVRVGPAANPSSFLADVAWEPVRHRAEILLAAYLDDITSPCEAFLLRPFSRALQLEGPKIGLHFDTVSKNYIYVPRCFAAEIRAMFPDAAIVDDDTPGASPKAQLEFGARQLAAGSTGLLISHVGVAKLKSALVMVWMGIGLGSRCRRGSRRQKLRGSLLTSDSRQSMLLRAHAMVRLTRTTRRELRHCRSLLRKSR